jgi:NAD(P)-dependent dehydrogenase (short-subunit alcohol dehydrogenase family)
MGRAIAVAYARQGARVAVQDIDLQVAGEVATEIRAFGGSAAAFGGDITTDDFAARLHAKVIAELGAVTILVNNAAVQERADWLTVGVDRLAWQWRGNVVTPWLLTRLCFPDMKNGHWGRVLMLSSVQGRRGYAGMMGYSTTKAAIDNMVTALCRELGPHGVTVNAIAPGYFDTYRNQDDFPDSKTKSEKGKWIPVGRVGEPQDVAGLATLLASDAGSYITGQVLYVDGGLSLR